MSDLADIVNRRVDIESQYSFIGWTNEEANQALHKRIVEDLCNEIHAVECIKVGHVYFEYMVDLNLWHEISTYLII